MDSDLQIVFICFNDSPSKMMENAFYFILKALFVLKIFNFFHDYLSMYNHLQKILGKLRKLRKSCNQLYIVQLYSYLLENRQKAPLNSFFKSRFSVKPSKFQICLAKDYRKNAGIKGNQTMKFGQLIKHPKKNIFL